MGFFLSSNSTEIPEAEGEAEQEAGGPRWSQVLALNLVVAPIEVMVFESDFSEFFES